MLHEFITPPTFVHYLLEYISYRFPLLLAGGICSIVNRLEYSMNDPAGAESIQNLKDLVAKNPNDVQACLKLGNACLKELNGTEALDAFQKATRLQPECAEAYFGLAKSFDSLQRYEEMLDAFKEACWLKPDWPGAHYNLGLGYMVVGLYEDALEPLKEAVKVKPDYAEAHRVLSLVYKLTGFTEQSAFHKKEASRLNPDFTG